MSNVENWYIYMYKLKWRKVKIWNNELFFVLGLKGRISSWKIIFLMNKFYDHHKIIENIRLFICNIFKYLIH